MRRKNEVGNLTFVLICAYVILLPLTNSNIKLGKVPMSGDVLLGFVIISYLLGILIYRKNRRKFLNTLIYIIKNKLFWFIVILILLMFCSINFAVLKKLALKETVRFASYAVIMFVIISEIDSEEKITKLINSIIIGVVIQVSIACLQYTTGLWVEETLRYRVPGAMGNPNTLSAYLILFLFPMILCTIREKNKKKRIFYTLISCFMLIGILITYSRNAYLALGVGSIILVVLYSYKLIILFGGVGGILLFIPSVNSRIKEFLDMTQNEKRIKLWKSSLKTIKEHPFTGVGNGNNPYYNKLNQKYPEFYVTTNTQYLAHNSYLKVWSELGILGIVCFIVIIVNCAIKIKSSFRFLKNERIKSFILGFAASFGAFLVMNLSDNLFFIPKCTTYFWIMIGLCDSIMHNGLRHIQKIN